MLALRGGPPPGAVLIDGRSGSGKTTLAATIAAALGARILRVEDLYPGWDGLAAGSRAVPTVLETGRFQRFDWHVGEFAEWRALDAGGPIVVEGCGALSTSSLDAANRFAARAGGGPAWGIWVECPDERRRRRALTRDGDVFRPHWERWAAQEEARFAVTRPRALARETRYT
ncbi:AAA family ATPase [Leucobacter sp. CSA1]|uniref:AAA family ATPase n=1 Tax=Leucobacter chromiisoli TaxID=2796471 RepID=A0A934Q7H1_9MICO|nr:AAA family ATPase [Leucobacter chromiisoli]